MGYLLARLDELTDGGKRRVWFRGKSHEGMVSGDAATLPAGTVVFLESECPPWNRARKARLEPWPRQIVSIQHLRALPHQRISVTDIPGQLISYGPSTLDDRNYPCSVGLGRDGGAVQLVLNYSGWPISDLGRVEYDVLSYNYDGYVVWVLPHTLTILAKSESQADKENKPWPPQRGLLAELYQIVPEHSAPAGALPAVAPSSSLANLVGAAGSPAPIAPTSGYVRSNFVATVQPPRTINVRRNFAQATFADGSASLVFEGATVVAGAGWAKEVFNEIRPALDAEFPKGLRIHGKIYHDGRRDLAIDGLDAAGVNFRQLWYRATVRRSRRAPGWRNADELARERPGSAPNDDAIGLFDIEEFALQSRKEAFRHLYDSRLTSEPVRILPKHGFVVALVTPATTGGTWYAWETVDSKNATYLFRPQGPEAVTGMLAWTAVLGVKRMDMLEDPVQRAALGFMRRVIHRPGETHLKRWWAEVCGVVGIIDGAT